MFEESIDTPYLCCNETCMKITDNLKYCTNIQQLGSIIVSLQVPQFIYQLSYSIDGIVIYDDGDSKVGSFILPTVNISTDDLNNRLVGVFKNKWICIINVKFSSYFCHRYKMI